ncbi:MAG: hypothetical protein FJ035_09920 [Chloroflexi bacterium]|nr:hypothetical protein [Chloroflexota bacterium]
MSQQGKPVEIRTIADRVDEDPDVSNLVSRLEADADHETATRNVTLRWGSGQIAVVKRAAAILGMPYQTYLKQVVFKQAIADIEHAEAALRPAPAPRRATRPPTRGRVPRL